MRTCEIETYAETRRRNHEAFWINRPGRIVFVGHHLSTRETLGCVILNLSLAEARLKVPAGQVVPHNFFLEINGIQDEIGCTLISQSQDQVAVAFNMLIDPGFLAHVRQGPDT